MTKQIIRWIIGIAVFLGLIFLGAALARFGWNYGLGEPVIENVGGGFSQGGNNYIQSAGTGSGMNAGEISATTTTTFLSTAATASTTVSGSLGRADTLIINAQSMGSSSAATLNFTIDVSNDKIDWFVLDQATSTATSQVVHTKIEPVHTWNVATSSATGNTIRQAFVIKDLFGKYFRIRLGTTGANQSVWINVVPIEQTPN